MIREQESTVERLAIEHGRIAVRDGFMDQHVVATTPRGQCWNVDEDGIPHETQPNFSVEWNQ